MTTSVTTVMMGCSCDSWFSPLRLSPPLDVVFLGFTIFPSHIATYPYNIAVDSNHTGSLNRCNDPTNNKAHTLLPKKGKPRHLLLI